MTDNNSEHSTGGSRPIEPVSISLTTASPDTGSPAQNKPIGHSPFIWLALGVLLTTSVVVVFLLPKWVDREDLETLSRDASASVSEPVATNKALNKKAISPWEKAQESRLRKETQEILSQMLEAQGVLANKGVEFWASEEYAVAMQFAVAGDVKYNEQDFAGSRKEYEQAATIFNQLVADIDTVFEATLEKGNKALSEGNAALATEAFKVALAIDNIDRDATIGMARAESLLEVVNLLERGDVHLERSELDEALSLYQQALDLDSHSESAKEKIALTQEKMLDRKFNQHMSIGFAALESNRLRDANRSFNNALKLKPRSAAARTALEQTTHKQTTSSISTLLAKATQLEERESWHEAETTYRAALKHDSSLAAAQEGETRASLRAKIHVKLEQIIAQPQRLYDEKVLRETLSLEGKLKALTDRGPVLTKQLNALAKLLNRAKTPVPILLISDSLTHVTVRKVGELGFFSEKALSLRPGLYVAIGIREGYRDTRVEFIVAPDQTQQTITIQAADKIALSN